MHGLPREECAAVELECHSCVQGTGQNVASVCHGLGSKELQQVFFQIYPDPHCAPMRHAFERAYREQFAARVERKPVAGTGRLAAVAAA